MFLSKWKQIDRWKLLDKDDILSIHQTIGMEGHLSTAILEKKFREFIGCEYAVHTASGRSALVLALKALDLGKSNIREVLVPDYTCEIVPSCVLYAGAVPVFVDVDRETFNMCVDAASGLITRKTKAIILVHTFGQPADLKPFIELGEDYGIDIISDVAQALGAEYAGKKLGSLEKVGVFSLNKNLACMRGGFVTTNDRGIARKVRVLRDIIEDGRFENREKKLLRALLQHYMPKKLTLFLVNEIKRVIHQTSFSPRKNSSEPDSSIEYLHNKRNWHTSLDSLDASLARSQLSKVEQLNNKRIKNAKILGENIKKRGLNVKLPTVKEGSKHVFTRFPIRMQFLQNYLEFTNIKRKLLNYGVLIDMTYKPLHKLPAFRHLTKKDVTYLSEELSRQVLPLPLDPFASNRDLDLLAGKLERAWRVMENQSFFRGEMKNG